MWQNQKLLILNEMWGEPSPFSYSGDWPNLQYTLHQKKSFRRIIDFLFTNRSEGKVVAEILENGRVINYDSEGNPIDDINNDIHEINEETENMEEFDIESEENSEVDQELSDEVNERLSSFEESIKVDVSAQNINKDLKTREIELEREIEKQKLEFVGQLEANPSSLIDLSMDRLKKIEEYYDELIADLENKIESSKKVS